MKIEDLPCFEPVLVRIPVLCIFSYCICVANVVGTVTNGNEPFTKAPGKLALNTLFNTDQYSSLSLYQT